MKQTKLTYLGNLWTPGGDAAGECIRHAQRIEELGYVNLGWTDQTQTWQFRAGWRPDLVPFAAVIPDHDAWFETLTLAAAVLARTERIVLATIIDSYRRPASLLAQMLNSLDQIGRGRFVVAIGTGENKQFLPYGLERSEPRNTRLEDSFRPCGSSCAPMNPSPVKASSTRSTTRSSRCPRTIRSVHRRS